MSLAEKKARIRRDHKALSVSQQCRRVKLSRSALYYEPAGIDALSEAEGQISMDGRGRCMDNIFIERVWRSLKQEAIYLEELNDGFKAHRVIENWMSFYNTERRHSALLRRTPQEVYWNSRNENRRHDNQPGYTLTQPPICPKKRDHFIVHRTGSRPVCLPSALKQITRTGKAALRLERS